MDKILGVISEYNPFHFGHLYQLQESKKIVNPDYTVAVMSGNFVERGDAAIIDKWSRAEMALKNGIDLVIELPLLYSISSAENFALGGIKILDSLKMDTTLSFGSECGDLNALEQIVNVLYTEPKEYLSILNHKLSSGVSFPKAREHALLMYLNDIRKFANVLDEPNNILGIEYLKAIQSQKSKIKTITIKRTGEKYNSFDLDSKYSSATAIRHGLLNNIDIKACVPESSYEILKEKKSKNQMVFEINTFEQAILYKLRCMSLEDIAMLPDVNEGLENKIKKASNSCNDLTTLISMIKSKRYTLTRINRILLYALLDITKKDMESSYKATPYIRVLGVNANGKELLSKISKNNPKANIVTSPKKFIEQNRNKVLTNMIEKDMFASNIYTLGYASESKANLDYTSKLITI